MKNRYFIMGIPLLALLLTSVASFAASDAEYAPGEVLVKFRAGHTTDAARRAVGAERIRSIEPLLMERMRLAPGVSVEEAVRTLRAHPDVEYAEPNYKLHKLVEPSDPFFGQQWAHENTGQAINGLAGTPDADIDSTEAWTFTTGSSDVIIGILDTGVDYNHPDLASNMWVNAGEVAGNGIDDDHNGYIDDVHGYDFIGNDSDPMDDDGHGTHVAGIALARGDNAVGVAGVMWTGRIMALKFLDAEGSGYVSDAVEAIAYAGAMDVRVINCSFGGYSYSQSLKDAIDASQALFLAAAGNDGMNNDLTGHYPSGYTSANVVSVAMSTQTGGISVYSNYGVTSVDLAAPGMYIFSSIPAPRESVASDSFVDGTLGSWSTGGTSSWVIEGGALSDASGSYANNADSWAMRQYAIGSSEGCTLQYSLAYAFESQQDYLYLEASPDGATWSTAATYSGSQSSGTYLTSLPPAGASGSLYVRFRVVTDSSVTSTGATIDDITLACAGTGYNGSVEYEFEHGTSMATPLVSGAAGLLLSAYPTLTAIELKDMILDAVEPEDSMAGLVATGGRLNVLNIFYPPPSDLSAPSVGSGDVTLAWNDRTSSETAYAVERSIGTSDSFVEVAVLGADTTSYTDGGLSSSTAYLYRVRAWSPTVGYSSYSNELSVTTSSGGSSVDGGASGGPCFIATAAYGSPLAAEVDVLRSFRDRYLMTSAPGRALVMLYYRYSPPAADLIARDERLRAVARFVLAPIVVVARHPGGAIWLVVLVSVAFVPVLGRGRSRRRKDK